VSKEGSFFNANSLLRGESFNKTNSIPFWIYQRSSAMQSPQAALYLVSAMASSSAVLPSCGKVKKQEVIMN
jgi:ABC-type molybdate transport system permease subunit